jgi:hypothetical protein
METKGSGMNDSKDFKETREIRESPPPQRIIKSMATK